MLRPTTTKVESTQQDPDKLARVGKWLFTYRTSLPLPIAAVLLLWPPDSSTLPLSTLLMLTGLLIIAAGEGLRAWGVHQIGAISRTRSDRTGPLIDTGPFSLVRNPLYLGNILLWVGFAVSARLLWFAPIALLLLGLEYHAIVRWEESLLEQRLGDSYRRYMRDVPRWIPRIGSQRQSEGLARFSLTDTLYSERGTLIAIVVGLGLLLVKARVIASLAGGL
jgi:protein-S-isoprenylcysteine O-methyltransferase Ste14